MRYTERKFSYKFGSFYDFIRMCFVLIMIAPFRLCYEVSSKVIYLKKVEIVKLLQVALLVMGGIIVLTNFLALIRGTFSITAGKFPLIMQLVSLILLAVLYYFFTSYKFSIYKQLDLSTFRTGSVPQAEESVQRPQESIDEPEESVEKQEKEPKKSPVTGKTIDLDSLELDNLYKDTADGGIDLTQIVLDDDLLGDTDDTNSKMNGLYKNSEVKAYQEDTTEFVQGINAQELPGNTSLSSNELAIINKNLEESVSSSKFLDKETINLFLAEASVDNFGLTENFSGWSVPNNFKMLS